MVSGVGGGYPTGPLRGVGNQSDVDIGLLDTLISSWSFLPPGEKEALMQKLAEEVSTAISTGQFDGKALTGDQVCQLQNLKDTLSTIMTLESQYPSQAADLDGAFLNLLTKAKTNLNVVPWKMDVPMFDLMNDRGDISSYFRSHFTPQQLGNLLCPYEQEVETLYNSTLGQPQPWPNAHGIITTDSTKFLSLNKDLGDAAADLVNGDWSSRDFSWGWLGVQDDLSRL